MTKFVCIGCDKEKLSDQVLKDGKPKLPYKWTRWDDGTRCPKCKPKVDTRNYAYGFRPFDRASEQLAVSQMVLAHKYRNKLRDIEVARREAVDKLMAARAPGVKEAEEAIARIEPELEELRDAIRAQNSRARKKNQSTEEQKARAELLAEELKEAYNRRKETRKAAFKDGIVKAELDALDAQAVTARKEAYNVEFAQLGWGSKVHVHDATQDFRKGAPPQTKYLNGGGHVAAQFPNGTTVEATVQRWDGTEPTTGQCWIRVENDHPTKPHARIGIRVGSEETQSGKRKAPLWIRGRFRMHRPVPPGAALKWVHLTRRRVGTRSVWRLILTWAGAVPPKERAPDGVVAIDLGWRRLPGNGIRIASWIGSDGATGEVKLDEDFVQRYLHADHVNSVRSTLFNNVMARLSAWVATNPLPEQWTLKTDSNPRPIAHCLTQWKSQNRLHRLIEYWAAHRLPGDSELFGDPHGIWSRYRAEVTALGRDEAYRLHHDRIRKAANDGVLWAWHLQNRHLIDCAASPTEWGKNFRLNMFRNFAAGLRKKYRTVVLEDINWRELITKMPAESDDEENKRVRTYYRMASPGQLASVLKEQMGQHSLICPEYTTRICHGCGEECEFDQARVLVHTCEHCGIKWDQDANAAKNLMAQHLNPPVENPTDEVVEPDDE